MSFVHHTNKSIPELLSAALDAISQNQFSNALENALAALKLDPLHAEAHHLAAHAYSQLGNALLADAMLERALALAPNHPQYHYNAAVNAGIRGDIPRAMAHYAQALRIEPDLVDALWNYGELLRLDEHFDLALDCFERLVALKRTDYKSLYDRMAICYSQLDRHKEAEAAFQKALQLKHTSALAHWEYALYKLSLEDFQTGFKYYDDRFLCNGQNNVHCHDFPYPLWQGAFEPNQTLLIHGEQGLGDEMMFASIFNELLDEAEKANTKVIIACKPPLVRLFSHNFPRAEVRAHKVGMHIANLSDLSIDAQLPMGNLMRLYRQNHDDFDTHRHPYFKAATNATAHYSTLIPILGREARDGKRRFRVGLMWGSNPANISAKFSRWTHQRSIPLNMFESFIDLIEDVEFISLQNSERGAEAALAPTLDIVDFSLDQRDFYDTAGLINNLDLVITVCTSVSHLAGGMGVETWVPLMKRADWRHGREREHSLWYEGTRYFRQSKVHDWQDVVSRMHAALHERVRTWKEEQTPIQS
ncbi:tetratricopeptide repeat protein [Hydromonas duriensis]|uniref:Tfp pilus assembly protein PilF n=1 Tax=Hydromonas duriensis TaxID=1527608 RepID=A0A4R6Y7Z3_9BURK|nr:tetratricopeptide repeat protein [Hydromonas duriensis]TDR31487.1 Tfp pilus assembly protein PilF [Hydromonas duriensis]